MRDEPLYISAGLDRVRPLYPPTQKQRKLHAASSVVFKSLALTGAWLALALPTVHAAATGKPWPPPELSDTGLYRDGTLRAIADGIRPYSPQYPLWTDGATKLRWVSLPEDSTIDASDGDAWRFPPGTRFWKQFSFGGRPVETRYIEKTGEGIWLFAAYVWNDDLSEATLVPASTGLKNCAEIAPGVRHNIPSVYDCKACHEGNGRDSVLGYGALQLSSDRDPLAPHAEPAPAHSLDLGALLRENRLKNAPPSWRTAPPAIAAPSPRARAALGYFHGNCSFCHNDQDPVSSVGMSLRVSLVAHSVDDQPTMRTAVGIRSKFQIRGLPPDHSLRLAPGDLTHSAILVRMRSRDGMSQMPPLGSKVVDADAVALISAWIREDHCGTGTPPSESGP